MLFAKSVPGAGRARSRPPKLLATNSYEAPTCSELRSLEAIRPCAADRPSGGTNSPAVSHLPMEHCAFRRNPARGTSAWGWLKGAFDGLTAPLSAWPRGMDRGGLRSPAVASGGQRWSEVVSSGQRWLAVPLGCGTFEYEASLSCLSKALRVRLAIAER